MARWRDVAALIGTREADDETDAHGFYKPGTETRRVVFCNKKSVGVAEFYKSQQDGVTALLKLIIRADDYHGERIVEFEGKRYRFVRDFESTNGAVSQAHRSTVGTGEFVELTLTDLSERREIGGGDYGDV